MDSKGQASERRKALAYAKTVGASIPRGASIEEIQKATAAEIRRRADATDRAIRTLP